MSKEQSDDREEMHACWCCRALAISKRVDGRWFKRGERSLHSEEKSGRNLETGALYEPEDNCMQSLVIYLRAKQAKQDIKFIFWKLHCDYTTRDIVLVIYYFTSINNSPYWILFSVTCALSHCHRCICISIWYPEFLLCICASLEFNHSIGCTHLCWFAGNKWKLLLFILIQFAELYCFTANDLL